ncbi:MAG TPA: hypothetical protein VII25_08230 [Candidatus Acidoferrum sp.]
MSIADKIDTHQKALSLNLDPTIFGSFAEIGAGQEVARWFLRVGAASGTVAKTISAYDKEVSDDLYGAGTRYVSVERLRAMLEQEWKELLGQLEASRGARTTFISFVDTVSARNFAGTNECHGWLGLRFQQAPGGPVNDVILHVNLRDDENVLQQEAIGTLGVNLIYGVYHNLSGVEEFLKSLVEELSLSRIEIDCVELHGPAFAEWDMRLVHASLVTGGFAEAVIFPVDGKPAPPTEVLYKKAIVMAPGRFDTTEKFHEEMIEDSLAQLPKEELEQSKGSIGLFSLTCAPQAKDQPGLSAREIVEHVEALRKLGSGALVFRERELYKMSTVVNRFTKGRIHFAVGLSILVRALQDGYQDLAGSLLEGVARLFRLNVRLSVFPMSAADLQEWLNSVSISDWTWEERNGEVHASKLHPAKPLDYLYQYLIASEFIIPMPATKD